MGHVPMSLAPQWQQPPSVDAGEALGSPSSGAVRIKAMQLTQLLHDERARAVKCHNFVRRIELQIRSGPCRPVERVLVSRRATALEKTDLLIALLRSCSIEARLRIYSIQSAHLRGLVADPARMAIHPVLEVRLGTGWLQVDTHHLDVPLMLGAHSRLLGEGARQGYGVHLDGAASWNGRCDARAIPLDGGPLSVKDWGQFRDAAAFARHCNDLCECLDPGRFGFGSLLVSGRLHRVRAAVRCVLRGAA